MYVLSIMQNIQVLSFLSFITTKQLLAQDIFHSTNYEDILRGLSSQIAEKEDVILCSDVRDRLFGPMDFSRRDLGALNIMRGRDNGLPDYNTVRKYFGLPRITNWSEINPDLFKKEVRSTEVKRSIRLHTVYVHCLASLICSPSCLRN